MCALYNRIECITQTALQKVVISQYVPLSNYKVYAYIVKHNYILGGMLFTICKAQLHVSATSVGPQQTPRPPSKTIQESSENQPHPQ
jgi:hypothetical protein